MPKYVRTQRCIRDYADLSSDERKLFKDALRAFLADLPKRQFRKSLRVRGVEGADGVFEMTWERDNGRATFQYGDIAKGEPDIIWRRIGGHAIFKDP